MYAYMHAYIITYLSISIIIYNYIYIHRYMFSYADKETERERERERDRERERGRMKVGSLNLVSLMSSPRPALRIAELGLNYTEGGQDWSHEDAFACIFPFRLYYMFMC